MDLRWRNFLLVVTLAAAAAPPAFGQAVVPTAGPIPKGETSATSVPDFSGLWVHANPGYEPLASGPTSLVNLSRRPNGRRSQARRRLHQSDFEASRCGDRETVW